MAHSGLLLLYQGNLLLSAVSEEIHNGNLSRSHALGIAHASFTKTIMLLEDSGVASLSGEASGT